MEKKNRIGLYERIKNGTRVKYTPGEFSLSMLKGFSIMPDKTPSTCNMYLGLRNKLHMDLFSEMSCDKVVMRIFTNDDDHKKDHEAIWFTPYNKGNLFKIRKDYKYYTLYYGTNIVLMATRLMDCVKYIKEHEGSSRIQASK